MAHPIFGRSVNPIPTRGNRLCPPNYYWHTLIFRPSDGPALVTTEKSYAYIDKVPTRNESHENSEPVKGKVLIIR